MRQRHFVHHGWDLGLEDSGPVLHRLALHQAPRQETITVSKARHHAECAGQPVRLRGHSHLSPSGQASVPGCRCDPMLNLYTGVVNMCSPAARPGEDPDCSVPSAPGCSRPGRGPTSARSFETSCLFCFDSNFLLRATLSNLRNLHTSLPAPPAWKQKSVGCAWAP